MFRFTIRDVLWLTVVVAMGVGWWFHVSAISARYRQRDEKLYRDALEVSTRVNAELDRIRERQAQP